MATGVVAAEVEVETFLDLALRVTRRTGVLFPFGAFQLSQPIANRRSCHEVILAAQLPAREPLRDEGVTNSDFLPFASAAPAGCASAPENGSLDRGSNASGGSMAP